MAGKNVSKDRLEAVRQHLEKRFADVDLDKQEPRISLSLGVTIPIGGYKTVRVDAGLSITRPSILTTEETFLWLEDYLTNKMAEATEHLAESMQ